MQVCNPLDRIITIKPKTIVGIIFLVTAIPENVVVSAVANNHLESS